MTKRKTVRPGVREISPLSLRILEDLKDLTDYVFCIFISRPFYIKNLPQLLNTNLLKNRKFPYEMLSRVFLIIAVFVGVF